LFINFKKTCFLLQKKIALKIPFPLPLSLPEANSGFVAVVVVVVFFSVVVLQHKGEKKDSTHAYYDCNFALV
jgi:hypothetical protein